MDYMETYNLIDVFKCSECGYEDSSFIPSGARHKSCNKYCEEGFVECTNCHRVVEKTILKMKIGVGLSYVDYLEIHKFILENHSFGNGTGKMIKYITPTFDTRTSVISCVRLDDKVFNIINENRHRNLKMWIMDYLND